MVMYGQLDYCFFIVICALKQFRRKLPPTYCNISANCFQQLVLNSENLFREKLLIDNRRIND